jgi:hypothetical protein
MPKRISQESYRLDFGVADDPNKMEAALQQASDIRKFEIQLYWTRATYFWTFIAAALAAYGAIQTMDDTAERTDLSVFLSCIGFVLSFGWYCANRGSKRWQENWENHVDLLENGVTGPLYKTVLERPPSETTKERIRTYITGPGPFSVSKINQIISVYISLVWILLIAHALPPVSVSAAFSLEYTISVGLAAAASITFLTLGRTHGDDYEHWATQRSSGIKGPGSP